MQRIKPETIQGRRRARTASLRTESRVKMGLEMLKCRAIKLGLITPDSHPDETGVPTRFYVKVQNLTQDQLRKHPLLRKVRRALALYRKHYDLQPRSFVLREDDGYVGFSNHDAEGREPAQVIEYYLGDQERRYMMSAAGLAKLRDWLYDHGYSPVGYHTSCQPGQWFSSGSTWENEDGDIILTMPHYHAQDI